jgi:hypothetical protein
LRDYENVKNLEHKNDLNVIYLVMDSKLLLYILETTWKQIRNETFKVHEMEQLY